MLDKESVEINRDNVTYMWMRDKGKGAIKSPGTHWSIPLINMIRIQLNNIRWRLLKASASLVCRRGHSTILSEGKGHAKETPAEPRCDGEINGPISIQ